MELCVYLTSDNPPLKSQNWITPTSTVIAKVAGIEALEASKRSACKFMLPGT